MCNEEFHLGVHHGKKKFDLLAWDKLCIPITWCGLRINSLSDINVSLLCKWLWELGRGEKRLWKRLIVDKYGREEGGWCTKTCNKAHRCDLWKGIMLCKVFSRNTSGF